MTNPIEIQADPEFGELLAYYPSDRARLLLTGGGILAAVWFVITVALWQVDESTAVLITVGVIAAATLAVGWYMAHLWNREVVLYARGFSYREGSNEAYIRYADIVTIRQRAARVRYFGGLVRRTVYLTTLRTDQNETIRLNGLYRRVGELSDRLDEKVSAARRPILDRQFASGETLAFGDYLSVSQSGLTHHAVPVQRYSYTATGEGDRTLPWDDYAGFRVDSGAFVVAAVDQPAWCAVALEDIDNARLLVELLTRRQPTARR